MLVIFAGTGGVLAGSALVGYFSMLLIERDVKRQLKKGDARREAEWDAEGKRLVAEWDLLVSRLDLRFPEC